MLGLLDVVLGLPWSVYLGLLLALLPLALVVVSIVPTHNSLRIRSRTERQTLI